MSSYQALFFYCGIMGFSLAAEVCDPMLLPILVGLAENCSYPTVGGVGLQGEHLIEVGASQYRLRTQRLLSDKNAWLHSSVQCTRFGALFLVRSVRVAARSA